MKSYLPFLSLIVLASCSTVYKSGQTPDDVYFSPARPQDEYVRVEKDDDRQYREDRSYEDEAYRDDQYLRMKVRNRRWSVLDDGYSYTYYPSTPFIYNSWSASNYWNYLYNPYCYCNNYIITNPKYSSYYPNTVYNKPRSFNLRVFDNIPVSPSTNPKGSGSYSGSYNNRSSNNGNYRNSGSNAGGFLRNVFGGSGSNVPSSSNSNSYGGSSSSSSSSGSNSSSNSSSGSGSRGNASRRN